MGGRRETDNPEALTQFFVRASSGEMVPLSSVVSVETGTAAAAIEQFNQLTSATISALPLPGVSTGDRADYSVKALDVFSSRSPQTGPWSAGATIVSENCTPANGALRETVVAVCRELCGVEPEQSTGGGTSDGRFIAPLGAEVVELGPVNATIHKVDECVSIADLERLPVLYRAVCERLLG